VSDHAQPFVLAGVMGWPVAHSRSPLIHSHWIAQYGLHGAYVPLPVQPEKLEAALRALPVLGFAGCNLTIPHKIAAIGIVDEIEPLARRIGAANTIVVLPDGSLLGRNTDAFGFIANLREAQPQWKADAGPAVMLGAGGAARAVLAGMLDAGATEVRICNRTLETAQQLAHDFSGWGNARLQAVPWIERHNALDGAALLVNTTSQGMQGQTPLDIQLDALPATALVTDIVYTPLQTPLLQAAATRGNPTAQGLGMLIHQARPAFEAWFGVLPQTTPALWAAVTATL
jgi:shikimate dehydrogenase